SCPASFGADSCKIYLLDKDGKIIEDAASDLSEVKAVRSVGSQGNETQRAIEAAVASSPSISYTAYCFKSSSWGRPLCPASVAVGTQGICDTDFTVQKDLGDFLYCDYPDFVYLNFPGNLCETGITNGIAGRAYVCVK
ncbi:MAG: hypothetical protein WC831_03130, partial [Parcubacteria group bacterium]